MLKRLLLCSLWLGIASGLQAADLTSETVDKALNPFLNYQAAAVARIDIAKLDLNGYLGLENVVTGSVGRSLKQMRPFAQDFQKKLLAAGATDLYVVHSLAGESFGPFYFVVPLSKDSKPTDIGQILNATFLRYGIESKQIGENLLVGSRNLVAQIASNQLKPIARPEFSEGLMMGKDAALSIVLSPSQDQRRVFAELLPPLPAELGGAASAQLIQRVKWISLSLDVSDKPRGRLIARGSNPDDAKHFAEFAKLGLKKLAGVPDLSNPVQAALTSGKLVPQVRDTDVTIDLHAENQGTQVLTAMLTDLTHQQWDNLLRIDVRESMKQLALAMHNFYDSHDNRFPSPANPSKDGKQKISWRVQLLPFIDPALYEKYRQNEPWDSEHNRKLLKEIPEVYTTLDQDRSKGLTRVQMPTNKGMMGGDPLGIRIQDVKDGTSNTVMFIQVDQAHAVPWTKPQDFEVDLKQPWKGIVAEDEEGLWSAFIDGSARYLSKTVDRDNLLKMLTIDGGEVVGP